MVFLAELAGGKSGLLLMLGRMARGRVCMQFLIVFQVLLRVVRSCRRLGFWTSRIHGQTQRTRPGWPLILTGCLLGIGAILWTLSTVTF